MFNSNFLKTERLFLKLKTVLVSYADMMSALMVLFLVVMAVTLISVTQVVNQEESEEVERQRGYWFFAISLRQRREK